MALLHKFKVVDNPQKFALYEKTCDPLQPGKGECAVDSINCCIDSLLVQILVLKNVPPPQLDILLL